jgi:hypothetical protein
MIALTFAFALRLVVSSVRRPAYDAYDADVAPGTPYGKPPRGYRSLLKLV